MDTLPTELIQSIIENLPFPALQSLRLTNRFFNILATPCLLPPVFKLLPYRPDTSRLLSISKSPGLSAPITKLLFLFGDVNEYYARHNTYFVQFTRDPEDRDEGSQKAWREHQRVKEMKELYKEDCCDQELLAQILNKLCGWGHGDEQEDKSTGRKAVSGRIGGLREIEISLNTCPFTGELWQRIWAIPSSRLLHRITTTERTRSILTALASLSCAPSSLGPATTTSTVTSFIHDQLPLEYFSQKLPVLFTTCLAFRTLTNLRLTLDYSLFPNEMHRDICFSGLGQCLRAATELRHFNLAFSATKLPDLELSTYLGKEWKWTHLHTFGLQGVTIPLDDLKAFLNIHRESLRWVQLGGLAKSGSLSYSVGSVVSLTDGISLSDDNEADGVGSLEDLCENMSRMKLERCSMVVCVNSDRSDLRRSGALYDEDWKPVKREREEQNISAMLEDLVVRGARSNIEWRAGSLVMP